MWFTAPSPAPLGALEVFRRTANSGATRDRLPQAWAPSQGAIRTAGRRPWSPTPLLGFLAPPATWVTGSANPGLASPGTFRPRGFSPPRRFSPPPLRERIDRCRSWGSVFRNRFGRSDCGAYPRQRPVAYVVTQPLALRNTRPRTPPRRGRSPGDLASLACVAARRPAGVGNTPSEHLIARPLRRLAPPRFPSRAFSPAAWQAKQPGPAPQGFVQPGNRRNS